MRARSLLLLLLFALFASAQTPLDIDAEPHHHRLLENDQVRVFALTLRPTEQAYAMHEHNLLVIALRDCELVMWSEGHSDVQNFPFAQGDARFLFGGRAIGVRNDRSSECQQIVVEFLNPKVTTFGYQYGKGRWDYGISALNTPDPHNVPVDPHARFTNAMQLGEAVAKDVQLPPGETLPAPEKESAQLLIALSDLDLKREGEERRGEDSQITGRPGLDPGQPQDETHQPGRAPGAICGHRAALIPVCFSRHTPRPGSANSAV